MKRTREAKETSGSVYGISAGREVENRICRSAMACRGSGGGLASENGGVFDVVAAVAVTGAVPARSSKYKATMKLPLSTFVGERGRVIETVMS